MLRRVPWALLTVALAACDAPVYYPNEPDPRPVDTGPDTTTGVATGTGTPTGTGTTSVPTVDGLPCSVESVTAVGFDTVNNSASHLDLFWLDFSCVPQWVGTVGAGQNFPLSSYATHSFYVQDFAGTKVAEITLDAQPSQSLVIP